MGVAGSKKQKKLHKNKSSRKSKKLEDVSIKHESFVSWCSPITCGGAPPCGRYAHTCSVVGSNMVFFGGFKGSYLSDTHIFNTETLTWSQPEISGPAPSGRAFHTSWVVGSKVYIFAGFNGTVNLSDLYILNLNTMQWTMTLTSGATPSARFEHATAVIGTDVYLFGGGNNRVWFNDLYILNTDTLVWSQPHVSGTPPPGRCAHALCTVGNRIYVIGGFNGITRLNDVYVLYSLTMEWQLVQTTKALAPVPGRSGGTNNLDQRIVSANPPPSGRAAHTAIYLNGCIVLFAGYDGQKRSNEVWLLDVHTHIWKRPLIYGIPPSVRSYHTAVVLNRKVWVFGGYDGEVRLNDLHVMQKVFPTLVELCAMVISKNRSAYDLSSLPIEVLAHIPKHK